MFCGRLADCGEVACVGDSFTELQECQVFEMLRSYQDRANYLVSRHCRIIAMTCTHAALKRKSMFEIGFDFDNVVMEEAGQILEVETFIPMCLQKPVCQSLPSATLSGV